MKQIITNYGFNAAAKTVTLSDFGSSHPVDLQRLFLIIDVTTNQILYNFADSSVATATISSNNVITLSVLPSSPANGDKLQVSYDVTIGDPTYQTPLLPSNAAQETGGNLATVASNTNNLVLPFMNKAYDYVGMSNADGNGNYQTMVFKTGGASGTTVTTLTLTYDINSNVTSITRS